MSKKLNQILATVALPLALSSTQYNKSVSEFQFDPYETSSHHSSHKCPLTPKQKKQRAKCKQQKQSRKKNRK